MLLTYYYDVTNLLLGYYYVITNSAILLKFSLFDNFNSIK